MTVKTSVGPLGSSNLQPGQHAGPGRLVCARKERATARPALRGKEASQLVPAIPVTVLSPGYYY